METFLLTNMHAHSRACLALLICLVLFMEHALLNVALKSNLIWPYLLFPSLSSYPSPKPAEMRVVLAGIPSPKPNPRARHLLSKGTLDRFQSLVLLFPEVLCLSFRSVYSNRLPSRILLLPVHVSEGSTCTPLGYSQENFFTFLLQSILVQQSFP